MYLFRDEESKNTSVISISGIFCGFQFIRKRQKIDNNGLQFYFRNEADTANTKDEKL